MPKTTVELITETLEELQRLGAGVTAPAEDTAAVTARIEPVVADLGQRGVAYIGDTDAIDDAVFVWLVKIMADELAPKFGAAASPQARRFAEAQLRKVGGPVDSGGPVQAEYF